MRYKCINAETLYTRRDKYTLELDRVYEGEVDGDTTWDEARLNIVMPDGIEAVWYASRFEPICEEVCDE